MASEKQVVANRNNALASTGPKTNDGKMAVRLNALRHGLSSQDALLPDEDPHELEELHQQVLVELQPQGAVEDHLVGRIVIMMWRLRRVERIETGIFAFNYYSLVQERSVLDARGKSTLPPGYQARINCNQYATPPDDEKKKFLELAAHAESVTRSDLATRGQTFMRGIKGDALPKLAHYESGLERSLYPALHKLQSLQSARNAEPKD